jgi:hypothetical protein
MGSKETKTFRAAVKKVVEEGLAGTPSRPSVDELVAYQLGELPRRQAESVSEYLVLHPELADQLLAVQGEIEDRDDRDINIKDISGLSDDQVAADFSKVLQRVAIPAAVQVAPEPWWQKLATRLQPAPLRLVAAMLIAGVSFWLGLEYAGHIPEKNIAVLELLSKRDAGTRGSPVLSLSPGTEHVLIALSLSGQQPYQFYTAEIINADGSIERRIEEIGKDPGILSFQLASDQLRGDRYTIVLYAIEDDRQTRLAEYELRLSHAQ